MIISSCEKIVFGGVAVVQIIASQIVINDKTIPVDYIVFSAGSREKINNLKKPVEVLFEILPNHPGIFSSVERRQLVITVKAPGEINPSKKCEVVCSILENNAIILADIFNVKIDNF